MGFPIVGRWFRLLTLNLSLLILRSRLTMSSHVLFTHQKLDMGLGLEPGRASFRMMGGRSFDAAEPEARGALGEAEEGGAGLDWEMFIHVEPVAAAPAVAEDGGRDSRGGPDAVFADDDGRDKGGADCCCDCAVEGGRVSAGGACFGGGLSLETRVCNRARRSLAMAIALCCCSSAG